MSRWVSSYTLIWSFYPLSALRRLGLVWLGLRRRALAGLTKRDLRRLARANKPFTKRAESRPQTPILLRMDCLGLFTQTETGEKGCWGRRCALATPKWDLEKTAGRHKNFHLNRPSDIKSADFFNLTGTFPGKRQFKASDNKPPGTTYAFPQKNRPSGKKTEGQFSTRR
jgi:hypothetical protein